MKTVVKQGDLVRRRAAYGPTSHRSWVAEIEGYWATIVIHEPWAVSRGIVEVRCGVPVAELRAVGRQEPS